MPEVTYSPFPTGTRIVACRQIDDGKAELWEIPSPDRKRFMAIVKNGPELLKCINFVFKPNEKIVVHLGYHQGENCFYIEEAGHA